MTGVLAAGARSTVFAAYRGRLPLVVRRSSRPLASLAWELELLEVLGAAGLRVPVPVQTEDGRRSHGGVVVQTRLRGHPPRAAEDWRRVAGAVVAVHEVTRGWRQRPGSADLRGLLRAGRGADVDLEAMPPDVAALVRRTWRLALTDGAAGAEGRCVVHGDLHAGNLLIDDEGEVAVLDWDEARVDVPALDLAALPPAAGTDVPGVVRDAALAWEVATCWTVEPEHARRVLRRLRDAVG
ncbi:phosphotransferase [Geodermatophilus sp. DSM 44513]|uniref:phosphotransferase enzyme family protein n=1 Tax=Geodermatophilus sp. DSM 44513 TaxID=1528104 RepID=UPI0028F74CF4|nr:phosphotransferase [Geodermatophilus sp. DSM 44513]WNV77823.1 phosphotransferase [Geodermatophilus sp. DSM 44513]